MSARLFVAAYLVQQGAQASPISASDVCQKTPCIDSRTIWNIVYSCLSTIILCTWVAVHPNIPNPYQEWPATIFRRMKLTALAILAPEIIILWAIRQWIIARNWAKSRGNGWSQTHAFFAMMGGFMLYVDGKPSYILMRNEDAKHAPRLRGLKSIDFYFESGMVPITKKEIEDKSKADILAKALVVMQTGWFALQCTSRLAQHLPLTPLELETVGFAVLNLVSYVLWWDKPLDVQCAFAVRVESVPEDQSTTGGGGESGGESGKALPGPKGATEEGSHRNPLFSTSSVWRHLERFIGSLVGHDHYRESWDAKMVPLMFSGSLGPEVSVAISLLATTVASVFGAIHCIGWSFQFVSVTERHLWRISSCAITGLPWPLWVLTTTVHVGSSRKKLPVWMLKLCCTVGYIGTSLYVLARIVLLVLAALSLRSLHPRSYETTGWTAYLPHI